MNYEYGVFYIGWFYGRFTLIMFVRWIRLGYRKGYLLEFPIQKAVYPIQNTLMDGNLTNVGGQLSSFHYLS